MTVFALDGPAQPDVPLVIDSPHSGADYPADFTPQVPPARYRRAEDTIVDRLFADAPALGLPLFKALFPRIYVDVNRARTDIDPQSVAGPLPFTPAPTAKARLGKGVIWMDAPPPPELTPLYAAPLPAAAVVRRLDTYWSAYRQALAALLDRVHAAHGVVYYVDCHSMQSVSTEMHEEGAGIARPEIVLSDRDGTSSDPAFTLRVKHLLEVEGFEVSLNKPYKGADLVTSHGDPAAGFHAVQIEVRRNLYMDEATLTPSVRFAGTRARLGAFLAALRAEVGARTPA
ncbi:MAG: N-formylglutamate amidohydrolase [Acuticoccus sp.]